MLELQARLIMKDRLDMNTNNLISNAYNIFKNAFLKRTHLETRGTVIRMQRPCCSAVVLLATVRSWLEYFTAAQLNSTWLYSLLIGAREVQKIKNRPWIILHYNYE